MIPLSVSEIEGGFPERDRGEEGAELVLENLAVGWSIILVI